MWKGDSGSKKMEDNEGEDINRGGRKEQFYVYTGIWPDYSDSQ